MAINQANYFKTTNPTTGLTDIFENAADGPRYINEQEGLGLFQQGLNATLLEAKPYPTTPAAPAATGPTYDFGIPSLDSFNVEDLLSSVESAISPEDTRKLLADLKSQQLKIAELMQPTAREKELQGQLAALESGFKNDVTTLNYRPGVDFFTFGRGVSQLERETALRQDPLQRQLQIEQGNRQAQIQGAEFISDATKEQLQFAQQEQQMALQKFTVIQNAVNQLQDNARGVLDTIVQRFQGLTFDQLDAGTQQQLGTLARNVGLPINILRGGMQVVSDQMKAERNLEQAKFKALQDQQAFENDMAIKNYRLAASKAGSDGNGPGSVNDVNASLYGPTIDAALKAGATPEEAVFAAIGVAKNLGTELSKAQQNNLLKTAKEMAKANPVPTAPASTSSSRTPAKIVPSGRSAVSVVGSFFSRLFGK